MIQLRRHIGMLQTTLVYKFTSILTERFNVFRRLLTLHSSIILNISNRETHKTQSLHNSSDECLIRLKFILPGSSVDVAAHECTDSLDWKAM